MKSSMRFIRQQIIAALENQVVVNSQTIGVYNRIPSDANYPLIRVYSVSLNESDQNRSSFITQGITRIEAIARYESDDGGDLDVNLMVDQILQIVRSRPQMFTPGNDFNIFTSVNNGVKYLIDDLKDRSYYRAIIELQNKVEQLN